jgi:DNA-binding transcriptional ArsR family regulator
MLLVVELDVAHLAATRFAISPLGETLGAVALRLPRLWPLVVTDLPYLPEFLCPAPAGKSPGFGEELAHLRATPEEPVRASLRKVFGGGRWPDTAKDLFERPRESLAEIAAELAGCHDRLMAPHWERMRSVLDADIAYHAGLLASGGARSLFGDFHPGLRWAGGKLFMADAEVGLDPQVTLGPDGLVLMPSVFIWPEWSVKKSMSTQTSLLYPARGVARVWDDLEGSGRAGDLAAVESLLGAPRARLLAALCSPATKALARRFGVTPGAVSQHLAVLHRGGLVDRQRSGRTVLYQTSELGRALLGTGS